MKNKIAIASAFVAASSFSTAEIVVNDFLSFEGFVDMSYTHTDQESGGVDANDNSFGIDQVEIDWLFDFDTVTAQIDLAYEGTDGNSGVVEQAFATYHMDGGSSITAGRFASMLGFEAFEPTGLYQYSFAYNDFEDITAVGGGSAVFTQAVNALPGYDQGVKYTYEGDNTFFGVSLVDGVDAGRLGGPSSAFQDSGYGFEIAGAVNYDNGVSWFGGARYNEGDDSAVFIGAFDDQYILDTYVTFETGAWIFAGELVYSEADYGAGADLEVLQALLMANFAYSDVASVTGRLSYVDGEQGANEEDFVKYTLAHGYAFTDNLFLVNEISYVDGEDSANDDVEVLTFAAELIFSF